jgi:hypothetical protein
MGQFSTTRYAKPLTDERERLRRWLQSGDPPQADGPNDESSLISSARLQGLAPLLASAVRSSETWSSASLTRLKSIERVSLVRGILQLDLVRRIQDLLLKRGLRALPLKGAAVAERFYSSIAHRPMSDVDLLALDDWRATCATMLENGFSFKTHADHAVVFVDDASGNVVELHHALTSCPGFFRVDNEGLWSRSVPGQGQVPLLPSVEDTLVSLSTHAAFQHGFVLTLGQHLDFTRIVSTAALDMERLLDLASRARALTALASALASAAIVFSDVSSLRSFEKPPGSLPRGLRRYLQKCAFRPLSLVSPSRPTLASIRWSLAVGRRLALVKLTLLPKAPDEHLGVRLSIQRAATRLFRILWRLCGFFLLINVRVE